MKILKYKRFDGGPDVVMTWSEANEEIAKKEAYKGEYTIEDDGMPEPVLEPTTEELINIMLGVTSSG